VPIPGEWTRGRIAGQPNERRLRNVALVRKRSPSNSIARPGRRFRRRTFNAPFCVEATSRGTLPDRPVSWKRGKPTTKLGRCPFQGNGPEGGLLGNLTREDLEMLPLVKKRSPRNSIARPGCRLRRCSSKAPICVEATSRDTLLDRPVSWKRGKPETKLGRCPFQGNGPAGGLLGNLTREDLELLLS
jgi:hypothetical protein